MPDCKKIAMENLSSRNIKQFNYMSIFCASTTRNGPKQFPQLIIYHYIHDNLFVASDTDTLKKV